MQNLKDLLAQSKAGDIIINDLGTLDKRFKSRAEYEVFMEDDTPYIIDEQGVVIKPYHEGIKHAYFVKKTNFLPLKKLERGVNLPSGFYVISRTPDGGYPQWYYLEPSKENTYEGWVQSYHHTSPHPTCTCANYGGYVWVRNYSREYTNLQYYREMLPFEIIEMKFGLYSWCKMSKDSFFNRHYLSGEKEFVRR